MIIGLDYTSLAAIIITATLIGILSRKTNQPAITAYIITGLILGPLLGIISETPALSTLSEIGLAFLLFLVGLEIKIDEIKELVKPSLIITLSQFISIFIVGTLIALTIGFSTISSIIIGVSFAFSSTAVVVKILAEQDRLTTLPGRLNISILIIQDILAIIAIVLINTGFSSPTQTLLRIAEVGALIGLIGSTSYFSSKYFLPKIFKEISENQHAFFIHSLAWMFLLITVSDYFGLSIEIGAFLAGVSIAQLPYSSEVQERIRPLTELFIAFFFVNLGLKITPEIISSFGLIATAVGLTLIVLKGVMFFLITDRLKFTPETSFKTSLNLTQASEFGLILGSLALSKNLILEETLGFLTLTTIITIAISSYLINYSEELYQRSKSLLAKLESKKKQDFDVRRLNNHAVLVGYDDRMAEKTINELEEKYEDIVIVDRNSDNAKKLANSDHEYIYGDFKHGEIRKASRISRADIVISFSPEKVVNRRILKDLDRNTLKILKADTVSEAAELYDEGADYVIVKNILTGNRLGEYIELFIEDEEVFRSEIEAEKEKLKGEKYE